MADITMTPASLALGADCTVTTYIAAAAITAGQAVYYDNTTGKVNLADADASSATQAAIGIAMSTAPAANLPVVVCTGGTLTAGAVFAKGTPLFLSKVAGGIAPAADITGAGTYWTQMGIGTGTTTFLLKPIVTGAFI
jgi:hypothetical protein